MSDKTTTAYKYAGREYDPLRKFFTNYFVECAKAKVLLGDFSFKGKTTVTEANEMKEYHEYRHGLGIKFFADDGGEPYKVENNEFKRITGADVVCDIYTAREKYKKSIAPLKKYLEARRKKEGNDNVPFVKDFYFITSKPATDSSTTGPCEIYFYKNKKTNAPLQINENGTEFIYSGQGEAKKVKHLPKLGNVYQFV